MVNEDLNITIKQDWGAKYRPIIGQDQSGNVVYVDWSNSTSVEFIDSVFNNLNGKLPFNAGLKIENNEITNVYCDGDCFVDDESQLVQQQLYSPGNKNMNLHALPAAALRTGEGLVESSMHSYNSLMEMYRISNWLYSDKSMERKAINSRSTVMGMNQLGFVSRTIELKGFDNKWSYLNQMGGLNLPNVGFPMCDNNDKNKDCTAEARLSLFTP